MSDYDYVVKGKLKIKSDNSIKKKKKKASKDKKKLMEQVSNNVKVLTDEEMANQLTKAEIAFQMQREKVEKERTMKKASLSHKQRVEEFNRHLESLTEHFDIPKVSWTK